MSATASVLVVNTKEAFEKVLSDAGNKVILIEFYAEWCGPCRLIRPKLEEWAEMYESKAIIVRVDVDDLEDVAMEYNVTSMPTFLFLQNKKQLHFVVGSKAGEKIEELLNRFCEKGADAASQSQPAAPSKPVTVKTQMGDSQKGSANSTSAKAKTDKAKEQKK